jgi:hypothetical protein
MKTVLLHYARQLWAQEWFEYKYPGTMLDDFEGPAQRQACCAAGAALYC